MQRGGLAHLRNSLSDAASDRTGWKPISRSSGRTCVADWRRRGDALGSSGRKGDPRDGSARRRGQKVRRRGQGNGRGESGRAGRGSGGVTRDIAGSAGRLASCVSFCVPLLPVGLILEEGLNLQPPDRWQALEPRPRLSKIRFRRWDKGRGGGGEGGTLHACSHVHLTHSERLFLGCLT